jgi:hypothetical protein
MTGPSLRSEGPVDAAGLWKAADGFEATARTHPSTASHEPLENRRTDASFPQAPTGRSVRPAHHIQSEEEFDHLNGPVENGYRRFAPTA